MFLKITRSGPRKYLQIMQAYRDPETGRPKQRYIGSLGRLDQLDRTDLDTLIDGLLKVTGRPTLGEIEGGITSENTVFEPALSLGDVWAIFSIWRELRLAQTIVREARRRRHRIDIEQLVRVMVTNRLSDPRSKLGVLRWVETVHLPGIDRSQVTHQNLLRAMDALLEQKEALEAELAGTLLPLFDQEMEVVFYDITTVRVEGEGEEDGELRRWGKAKEGDFLQRQFAVGVVQTADGFPVMHEVFEGNVSEPVTVQGVVKRLRERFPVRRVVLVADRAMISYDNLDELERLGMEYIVAVPARRFSKLVGDLEALHERLVAQSRRTGAEAVVERRLEGGRRLVVAHSPEIARRSRRARAERLVSVLRAARALVAKLEAQDRGERGRGRPLTEEGAKATLWELTGEKKVRRLLRVDLEDSVLSWYWDVEALTRELVLDGKLVLITNVEDLPAAEVVRRYKGLADIERGFRVLKSEIEIAPVYHRLPDRIRAHALICFLALVIQRVMRWRIRKHGLPLSPEHLLERLKAIQHHRVRLATGTVLNGVSAISPEQRSLFEAIEVPAPTRRRLEEMA